eukprot:TRINITY_DN5006_c0_g1_i23.p1 TRINITY_DN5006_c0_g1~~TRINITY_DN5006_c0_g1_i23.p1  ORF type:complete len:306 (+),score=36.48 TRINITY_DN5006_c0_g1_i23:363-1280(+)
MLARVLKCSPDEPRYTRSLRRHLNRTPLCFDNLKSGEKSYVELDPKDLRIDERFFLPIAEKAKAMMMARVSGTFFTSNGAIKTGNLCHESTMPYILHKNWPDHPIIALRKDEVHYNNIKEDNNSTLIIYPHLPKHIQPTHVPLPKVSLLGPLRSIHAKTDKNLIMTIYNKFHPVSRQYFKQNHDKFEFFELCVSDVVLVKASGATYTITAKEFGKSPEDPIALYSKSLIEETNTKYEKELQVIFYLSRVRNVVLQHVSCNSRFFFFLTDLVTARVEGPFRQRNGRCFCTRCRQKGIRYDGKGSRR